jgi:hypothetical protein
MRPSTLRPVRLVLVGTAALVAAAFWWFSFSSNLPPYFVLDTFRNRFPQLWENWDPNSRNTIAPVGYAGIAIVVAVIASKLAAMQIERRWPAPARITPPH